MSPSDFSFIQNIFSAPRYKKEKKDIISPLTDFFYVRKEILPEPEEENSKQENSITKVYSFIQLYFYLQFNAKGHIYKSHDTDRT